MKRKVSETNENIIKRVKTEESTSIVDLPANVMVYILEFFTPSERRNLLTVSIKWMQILVEYFAKDSYMTFSKDTNISEFSKVFSNRTPVLQQYRVFHYLEILSFPDNLDKVVDFSNAITLIIGGVKHLTIKSLPPPPGLPQNYMNTRFFAKMPNLQYLEVEDVPLLGDLSYLNNLQEIKINSELTNLFCIREIKRKKAAKVLSINKIRLPSFFYKWLVPFMNIQLKNVFTKMFGNMLYAHATITSDYNFCERKKMTPDHVTGIAFTNDVDTLAPLKSFRNLKKLELINVVNHDLLFNSLVRFKNRITHLSMSNTGVIPLHTDRLDIVLRALPKLRSLEITGLSLQEEAFTHICKYASKLKELVLLNGNKRNEISIETILQEPIDKYSLKEMVDLKKLVIESSQYEYPLDNDFEWPTLPNLKELSLSGECFDEFEEEHFEQMANNCPKVTSFEFKPLKKEFNNYFFIPIIENWGENLTFLSLPGEGIDDDNSGGDANETLVGNIIELCCNLETLIIKDNVGLSLSLENVLFNEIPSLTQVMNVIEGNTMIFNRIITRDDLRDIKSYLVRSLAYYSDVAETVEYVMDYEVSSQDRLLFYRAFETEFPGESDSVKNLYSVTKYFLNMQHIDLCKLFVLNQI